MKKNIKLFVPITNNHFIFCLRRKKKKRMDAVKKVVAMINNIFKNFMIQESS